MKKIRRNPKRLNREIEIDSMLSRKPRYMDRKSTMGRIKPHCPICHEIVTMWGIRQPEERIQYKCMKCNWIGINPSWE